MMQGWLKVKGAAEYCGGVSERTVRSWLASGGLRHVKVRGTILIKRAWVDEFLTGFEVDPQSGGLDQIVEQVMENMR